MIVTAGTIGMLVTTQPAVKPGITVQENTTKIVTRCGSADGHSFIFTGWVVSTAESGWEKDTISPGQVLLIYNDGKPDIIFMDATKQIQSARGEGAAVIEVEGGPPGFRLILAVYQGLGTIEHYLFGLDENGSGKLAWGTARAHALLSKSSLFTANCQAP